MINGVIVLIIVILIIGYFTWATIYITKKYLIPKNEIENMKLKNEKYNLFSRLSIPDIDNQIRSYITDYLQRYIAYKFISKKIEYIRDEDVETMIKDITKLIYLEISELYIFYIKMVYTINEDEDLLKYINSKVKEISIELVTNYNSAMK